MNILFSMSRSNSSFPKAYRTLLQWLPIRELSLTFLYLWLNSKNYYNTITEFQKCMSSLVVAIKPFQ